MNKIKVKAASGLKVPLEGNPRRYITSEGVSEVADTAYYLRQIDAGDLEIVTEDATAGDAQNAAATDESAAKKEKKTVPEVTSEQP